MRIALVFLLLAVLLAACLSQPARPVADDPLPTYVPTECEPAPGCYTPAATEPPPATATATPTPRPTFPVNPATRTPHPTVAGPTPTKTPWRRGG